MSMQQTNSDVENLPCLDLFDSKPTGSQILGSRKIKISSEPLNAASTQLRFSIPSTEKEFTNLSFSTIELTYKCADANGADVGGQGNFTGFPGDHGDLMIKKGKVTVGDNNIIETTSNYGLQAFVQTLLGHDTTAKETKLSAEGWYQDGISGLVPNNADATATAGRLARRTAIENGTHQTIIMQPKFGIFQQNKLFPPNTPFDLEFEFANNAFFFNASGNHANGQLKLVPIKAVLTLYRYTVRDTVYKALVGVNLGSNTKPAKHYKYPYQKLDCTEDTISIGSVIHDIQFSSLRKRPNKVLVLFMTQACHAGSYQANPAHFLNAGVSEMVLEFNGAVIGRMESNFTTGAAKQAYDSLMRAVPHKSLEASSNGISFEDFKTKYTIFGWDTTYGYGATQDIQENVDIRIGITFRAPTQVVMTAIVITETNKLLELPNIRSFAKVI